MNVDFEIKQILIENSKPVSDLKLIKEYAALNDLDENTQLIFTKNYVGNDTPLQYLVGFEYFLDYKIVVNNSVLIPRMETEEVVLCFVNKIKEFYAIDEELHILDMCTGSGVICIAISQLLKEYNIKYYASDISIKALEVAQNNFSKYNLDVQIFESDIFDNISVDFKFDAIISNPPYLSTKQFIPDNVLNHEPHLALFDKKNDIFYYEKIISNINKYINKKNVLCFEIGHNQANKITKSIYNCKVYNKFDIIKDVNMFDRIFIATKGFK